MVRKKEPGPRPIHVFAAPALIQAAKALSNANPSEAIGLYTQVLYETSPGHVVALLNRSLAYVWIGRPELAAVDAYRAAIASNEMRSRPFSLREFDFDRYLAAERRQVAAGASWFKPESRYIVRDGWRPWRSRPLASFLIDDPGAPVLDLTLSNLCARLEVKATYRLCGALLECEGGCLNDAFGLISDGLTTLLMTIAERRCFHFLGDEVMLQLETLDRRTYTLGEPVEDDEDVVAVEDAGGKQRFQVRQLSLMKNKVTMVSRELHPEDEVQPNYEFSQSHEGLQSFVKRYSPSTSPYVLERSQEQMEPDIELRASRDISPGDLILTERNAFHVSTCIPEKAVATNKNSAEEPVIFYCDSCATRLLLPEPLVNDLIFSTPDQIRAFASSARDSIDIFRRPTESPTAALKEYQSIFPAINIPLSLCACDHHTIYCSNTCRRLRRPFDEGLHNTMTEQELRLPVLGPTLPPLEHVAPDHPRSLYNHPKAQILYDLLFLRVYASAMYSRQHPLELLQHVNGGLYACSTTHVADRKGRPIPTHNNKHKTLPWSFTNNIIKPINSIHSYHRAKGEDYWHFLKYADGWMINTMLAKIQHATQVSRGPVYSKSFDGKGKLRQRFYHGGSKGEQDRSVFKSQSTVDDVWVGRLDPLLNMIRVADPAKGEVPNVAVTVREGLEVYAPGGDGAAKHKPCILAGEALLRPALSGTTTASEGVREPSQAPSSLTSSPDTVVNSPLDLDE
ncbi:MAG: hypothetical protein LQ342_008141 [Letrouitia transgressa]|nr:MAG: hypothetical protein LQ342_008141 [Letrouitia transgressa]